MKLIEIEGEAAANGSAERQRVSPEIPPAKLVAIRNRLIHGYYDVDVAVVVQTVREDFPSVITALESMT